MSRLFESVNIKNLALSNRFVRSATWDGYADHAGYVSERQIQLCADLAAGGVGMIISGILNVHPSGQSSLPENFITDDKFIPGFHGLTSAIHEREGKIVAQLWHGGRECAGFLQSRNQEALAPSFVEGDPYFAGNYRPLAEEEIWEIIGAFGDSARRAREAGFDAVQLHGAHGYLFSQFLSPHTNRRDDQWGGAIENRLRFHREVLRSIRSKVGEDYPVLIKIGVQDGFPRGLELDEGKIAAKLLAEWGFDALEVSLGMKGANYEGAEFRTNINTLNREGYYRCWAQSVKDVVDVPVILVGGLRSYEFMEEVVERGDADLVALSRPFLCEPDIVNEWKSGRRSKAACVSCNGCVEAMLKEEPAQCIIRKGC